MNKVDPRTLCDDGSEPLMKGVVCDRCGITDWYSFPEKTDIRCGGCGLWFITEMMLSLGVEVVDASDDTGSFLVQDKTSI